MTKEQYGMTYQVQFGLIIMTVGDVTRRTLSTTRWYDWTIVKAKDHGIDNEVGSRYADLHCSIVVLTYCTSIAFWTLQRNGQRARHRHGYRVVGVGTCNSSCLMRCYHYIMPITDVGEIVIRIAWVKVKQNRNFNFNCLHEIPMFVVQTIRF